MRHCKKKNRERSLIKGRDAFKFVLYHSEVLLELLGRASAPVAFVANEHEVRLHFAESAQFHQRLGAICEAWIKKNSRVIHMTTIKQVESPLNETLSARL